MSTFKYEAEIITSGGTLKVNAVSSTDGEVLAVFKDGMGSWRKSYIDVQSFKDFIKSLHTKDKINVSEVYKN